ncbi:TetR/AcrR family transcriptional regulator [Agrobacterium pusense]|uniref:TetR/AcrR family transcriptional regulator n=1 Tax=Agrobacterium pusense TaxID=648995 RepID=UPI003FCF3836
MSPKQPPKRRRLPPTERRDEILQKAINLFAEHGFESSTRELARQLGITQPLLYRYFPSKDDLIREAYRTVYLDRWNIEWDRLLCDRNVPLEERLKSFYASYTHAIFTREWMRIYLFSGLKGADINRWYIGLLEERILQRIAKEYRHLASLDDHAKPSVEEMELAWALHSGIFYLGVREHIFSLPPSEDHQRIISSVVEVFHVGIRAYFAKHAAKTPAKIKAHA